MKRISVFIIFTLGTIITIYLSYSYLTNNYYFNNGINNNNDGVIPNKISTESSLKETTTMPEKSGFAQIREKDRNYVCGDSIQNSNEFISEYIIPFPCSQPVGLTFDKDNNIWIAANWAGHFLVFNPQNNTFIKNISLPQRINQGTFGSMIWDMKFDKNGDLWFTDENSNSLWKYYVKENKFEKYKTPTRGSYPSSLAFDSKDRVWFTEIFGKKLGLVNPLETENNTTKGIKELDLEKIVKFETMGPLSTGYNNSKSGYNNTNDEILWLSTVDFPYGGQIVKFDVSTENSTVYNLNNTNSVPISVAEDENGMIWTNDHASSLILMLDPKTGNIKQYATSPASTRNTTTLPYFNEYSDGKIWFNEHEGNAIAYYDSENKTLIEYHIPTKDKLWGNTSNPLRFTIDYHGSIWFTEWTENKIGVLHKEKMNQFPISLSTSKDPMIIDSNTGKGDIIDVYVNRNNFNNSNTANTVSNELINMFVTSSISKTGQLWNLTSKFNKDQFMTSDIPSFDEPYKVTLEINPTNNIVPGNYTLTISARYDNIITYSKIIDLIIK
ncbi:MAG: hypothetical protein H0X03_02940 [Nitrosopumilus sp.]|nr:hypothetical protein [Nitrosopumilus sp.]